MPRPRKHRRLARPPREAIYKPAGIPLESLSRVLLLSEELEALRLADLEGLSQVAAAGQMGVSRSTFQRILAKAHRQVALALVEGQALQLEGSLAEAAAARTPGPRHPGR
ncbi:MAG TPA: DUF134 domain-containing protein [Anaerolineales bacterium]